MRLFPDTSTKFSQISSISFFAIILILSTSAAAQSTNAPPGWLVRINGDEDTLFRERVALFVPEGGVVSPFVSPGPFTATWTGNLHLEKRRRIIFLLLGNGSARLTVDDQILLEGDLPLHMEASERLSSGLRQVELKYKSPTQGAASMQLHWQSREFLLEPIPPSALRFDRSDTAFRTAETRRLARRTLLDSACLECHRPARRVDLTFPPLRLQTLRELRSDWLLSWIQSPAKRPVGNLCPTVVAPDTAADLVAWLTWKKSPASAPKTDPVNRAAQETGKALAETLRFQPWVETFRELPRFTPAGLLQALREPDTALHLPDIRLTDNESQQLATWIGSTFPPDSPVSGDPGKGGDVFQKHCAVCHDSAESEAPDFEIVAAQPWGESVCESSAVRLPSAVPSDALREHQKALCESMTRPDPVEFARQSMRKLNCVSCHTGQEKFPDLTYVGEKFETDWLEKLFLGKTEKSRDWLPARMPAFPGHARALARGLALLHGRDPQRSLVKKELIAAYVDAGKLLCSVKGYACINCHAIGSRPPLAVFEGQGPNLILSRKRLRYEFYQIWMQHPQRVQPTVIMPRYLDDEGMATRGDMLDGDARAQFEAIWDYLFTVKGE